MRRVNPKYLRIAGIIAAVLLVLVLIGGYIAYSKREAILQSMLVKAKTKARRDYNLDLKIASAHFTGLATVTCNDISIVPEGRDSLLHINHFEVSVKILPLIFGNVKLAQVNLTDGFLSLTDRKGIRNFDFLFRKKKDSTATKAKADLSVLANNLIREVLYKIPDDLNMQNFTASFVKDSATLKLHTKTAIIDDGDLTSTIVLNDGAATWHFAGTMHPSDKEIDVKWYADGGKVEVPYIEDKYKLKVNFDNLNIKLTDVKHKEGETRIFSSLGAKNLLINHAGISARDVVIPDGAIDANLVIGENYVSIDSSSVIHLKKITANPYIKYVLKPKKRYELKLNMASQEAQDVFDSFPGGTFESVQGMKVAGKLAYHLTFMMDHDRPEDLVFDSRMDKSTDFKILQYGRVDLSKINRPFEYTAYEKGKAMRTFMVGPQNPNYTPLNQISTFLRDAVMTAEDPTFFKHKGFMEESIRKSIVTDIKERKFARGGSTMSMQLVKNVFLSREKTVTRKFEEMLLVWLVENNGVVNKSRMMEVYFNIIEWGRGIYGIKEAANYYFGKAPSELNLGESIFLASIVPKPKTGLYYFMPDGSLRPGLVHYFNSLGRLMAGEYRIKRDTATNYGFYDVYLRSGLRQQVAPVDSATAERLIQSSPDDEINMNFDVPEEPEERKPNFFQRLFGKKDTVAQRIENQLKAEEETRIKNIDTAGKTKKQIRQEKREIRRQEDERKKQLKAKGLL